MIGVSAGANITGKFVDSNYSTTPLNSGQSFEGDWTDVLNFPSIVFACKTDQDGTLYAEFSNNASAANSSLIYKVTAGTNEVHRLAVTRRYARLRFINDSGANQTSFEISLILGNQTQLNSTINNIVQSDADAQVTRPIDFNLLIAEGLYQKRNNTIKDGFNLAISSGTTPEDVWSVGSTYTGFPIGATEEGQIVVDQADVGTVYYSYLESDTSTDYVFGSIAINGSGNYNLGHNVYRCNFMYFVSSNTSVFNIGLITLRHITTTANVFCQIPVGFSQSYTSAYTVPYGSSIYLDRLNGQMRGATSGTLEGFFWFRPYQESPRLRFPFVLQFGSLFFDDIDYLVKIPERTDIIPRITLASTNNLSCQVSYRFIKVKE